MLVHVYILYVFRDNLGWNEHHTGVIMIIIISLSDAYSLIQNCVKGHGDKQSHH